MSRRWTIALAAALLTACSGMPGDPAPATDDGGGLPPGSAPPGEAAGVVTVLDGDSMVVDRGSGEEELRLAGVNAPERGECLGDEARDWLTAATTDGVTLVEVGSEGDTDQFGRLLRDVWAGDRWLNREAVAEGYAMVIHTGRDLQDELLAAGGAAWESGIGMWATEACGRVADDVVVTDLQWDPPGPDDQDPNGEYATVANQGTEQVDLTGWVLRDESTQNRYTFGQGDVLGPGGAITVFSGCGDDTPSERFWCAPSPVWSNGGDTVLLLAPGGTVADRLVYP